MRNSHAFCYTNKQFGFESEEDYKDKYRYEEKEIAKRKQSISKEITESMTKVTNMSKKPEEENHFLLFDENKNKKEEMENSPVFIPQSKIDFESANIRYPKYSPTIFPYISPIKVKSPSKRFEERMSKIHFSSSGNESD